MTHRVPQARGSLKLQRVADWETMSGGARTPDCTGVSVDSQDNVYVLRRVAPKVSVYDRDGALVSTWGDDVLSDRPHGITIDAHDDVYCVDSHYHCIFKFTPDGDLLQTIGDVGIASDTGFDGTLESIRGGPPFNLPTYVAVAEEGDLYVSDGYGNCRIHQFSPLGELIVSWGRPGSGALGEFRLPHGVAVDAAKRILVADRDNNRVQVFDSVGRAIEEWLDVQRPTSICISEDGTTFISELAWKPGELSARGVEVTDYLPSRISVFDAKRELIARWDGCDDEMFVAAHDIAIDSRGDMYVAEVSHTFGGSLNTYPYGRTLEKFVIG